MDELEIKTTKEGKVAVAEGPSPRVRARESQMVHVAFETLLGVFYTFPDMSQEHYHELIQQLDVHSEQVIARNLSGVTLVLPIRILSKLWLLQVDEDWKLHETSLQARRSELWTKS